MADTTEARWDHNKALLTAQGAPAVTQPLVGAGGSCSHLWPLALTKYHLGSSCSISGTSQKPIAFKQLVQRPLLHLRHRTSHQQLQIPGKYSSSTAISQSLGSG